MTYPVGYQSGNTVDIERVAWRSDAPRPIAFSAWYPANSDAPVRERLIGPPGAELFRMGAVSEGAPLNTVRAHWPVVLLSHGTGGSADGLCWLGVRLAAQGYVALAASHHGNTAVEPYLPEGFLCWWERARDLTVLLDWAGNHPPFEGRLNLDHVFAAGFSLGGYTVLALAGAITNMQLFDAWRATLGGDMRGPKEFPDLADHVAQLSETSAVFRQSFGRHGRSYQEPRIKAVLAMAPAPPVRAFEPDSLAQITLPTRLITGDQDTEAPFESCTRWLQHHNPAFEVTQLRENVGHYVFLPEATDAGKESWPDICRDAPGVDRSAIHEETAAAADVLFRAAIS